MIVIENTETFGWEAAVRGMRNPKNSWDLSDSTWTLPQGAKAPVFTAGEQDLRLMKLLAKAGTDHGKFLRMICVTADLTAPLYWWKEFDTYKVGTVANSCSTMHKIHARAFTREDFSREHLTEGSLAVLDAAVAALNESREKFLETKDKLWWWQMIQLLPSSYDQKRTVQLNYAVLKNMYHARRTHKLDEWRTLCAWVETLPYSELIME